MNWSELSWVLVGASAVLGAQAIRWAYPSYLRISAARQRRKHLYELERQPVEEDARERLATKTKPPARHSLGKGGAFAYITRLEVVDLRCFEKTEVHFRFPGEQNKLDIPNVTLLVGGNGAGKSTLLKAVAMAALGPVLDNSGFVPYRLVRQGAKSSTVTGDFLVSGSSAPIATTSRLFLEQKGDLELMSSRTDSPLWEDLYDESSPSFLVVGYGINRKMSDESRSDPSLERGRRRRRYQRISSLFDETVSLVPFGAWIPYLDSARRQEVAEFFARLLPEHVKFTGRFIGSEPVFDRSGVELPLRALSDGFRSYIGWLGDLLFHINAVAPQGLRMEDVGGIALVDEVDLLLHPSWQRTVVPKICRALPKIQFVVTTHSPIVTGTLQSGNVLVAREDMETGRNTVSDVNADLHGLNAEQVLMSSYFGLDSTRAPDVDPELKNLLNAAVRGDDGAAREYLTALTEGRGDGQEGPQ